MAAGILARPHAVPLKTNVTPAFEGRDYQKWLGTFKDIPEHVIDALASNAERNAFIAKAYADNRKKFGKTIIFTDRWFQCEAIAAALEKHKVRAGAVYSHVDAPLATAEQRRKRDADENAKVLQRFRDGELDVLINVRMLTEGTDIPDAQTVFITRQTTSTILLTQMVGRALRGPKFNGTSDAYIVSFEDDWRQQIQWVGFELDGGTTDDVTPERPKRPPLQLISIGLVKRLARQMDGGANVASAPFMAHLPVGWYRTLFDARRPDEDDVEPMDLLVMVYEDERAGFERLVAHLLAEVPEALADESVTLEAQAPLIRKWREAFLAEASRSASDLETEILQLARHIAQRGAAPLFFPFEVRADHDLDAIARDHIQRDFGPRTIDEALRAEFAREDRFWRTLFYRYEQFRHAYDGCVTGILNGAGHRPVEPEPIDRRKFIPQEVEPAVKREVIRRDGNACLACGTTRNLEVDHIVAVYHGGSHEPGNLQTLCKRCNGLKDTRRISFRVARTALPHASEALPDVRLPSSADAANVEAWERFLRCTINFFYECAAVGDVAIAGRGERYYNWTLTLRSENPAVWLKPHLSGLLARIQGVRESGGKARVQSLRVVSPGQKDLVVKDG